VGGEGCPGPGRGSPNPTDLVALRKEAQKLLDGIWPLPLCKWLGGQWWAGARRRAGVGSEASPAAIGYRAVGLRPCQAMWLRIPTETASRGRSFGLSFSSFHRQATSAARSKLTSLKPMTVFCSACCTQTSQLSRVLFQPCQPRLGLSGDEQKQVSCRAPGHLATWA
jgi:hypothetical protein